MDLEDKTRNELLEIAKELGVTRRSKKNKKKLVSSIIEARQVSAILVTKKPLVEQARSLGIKNATTLNKEELKKVIEDEKKVKDDHEPQATDAIVYFIHEHDYRGCPSCKEKRLCIHGKTKYFCKECDGSLICKHDKKVFNCYECSETRRKTKKLGKNFKKKIGEALDRFEVDFRKDSLPHFGSFLSELGLSEDAVREGVKSYERFVGRIFSEKNLELVRGLVDENVINEATDELKEGVKVVSLALLETNDVTYSVEEDESCGGGCLIEGYDDIHDRVADLNARDN